MKEKIESMKAPAAIGPYSQAVNNGGLVFVSGQLPIDCETGEFVSDDVSDQTRQSLENIKSILADVGYGMDRILKTTVYLQDMNDFSAMNQVYVHILQPHILLEQHFKLQSFRKVQR